MTKSRFGSLQDYSGSLASQHATTFTSVVAFILGVFPQLEAKIAWNVPQIHLGDDYVFGISSFANHLSLAPWSSEVIATFAPRLEAAGYVVRKNLFQVPIDRDIDQDLLTDLVTARLEELA